MGACPHERKEERRKEGRKCGEGVGVWRKGRMREVRLWGLGGREERGGLHMNVPARAKLMRVIAGVGVSDEHDLRFRWERGERGDGWRMDEGG